MKELDFYTIDDIQVPTISCVFGDHATSSQLREHLKDKVIALSRIESEAKRDKRQLLSQLSDPERVARMVKVTLKILMAASTETLTNATLDEKVYSYLTEEEKDFFDSTKYNIVYNLHNKAMNNQVIKEKAEEMKEAKVIDNRSLRHKNTPSKYITEFSLAKLVLDMLKSESEKERRLAAAELSILRQAEEIRSIKQSLEQQDKRLSVVEEVIGLDEINERKLKALSKLGVKDNVLEAYRLKLDNPKLTREEIAVKLGRGKRTVVRWFVDLEEKIKLIEDQTKKTEATVT